MNKIILSAIVSLAVISLAGTAFAEINQYDLSMFVGQNGNDRPLNGTLFLDLNGDNEPSGEFTVNDKSYTVKRSGIHPHNNDENIFAFKIFGQTEDNLNKILKFNGVLDGENIEVLNGYIFYYKPLDNVIRNIPIINGTLTLVS